MSGQSDEIQVHRRFRGPPSSANGGYVAGLLAEWIEGPAQVDLLAPIPLEFPLHRRRDESEVMLHERRPFAAVRERLKAGQRLVPERLRPSVVAAAHDRQSRHAGGDPDHAPATTRGRRAHRG